ncbi:hypothetical protein J6E39_00155 [bacterium]|nr:hypothetical protein [bacterium]
MTRKAPKLDTLRALFAKSGNCCAFPGCKNKIINDKNQLIGEVCHIEAAEEGGERYNPNQTDEERRHYDNLILLCHEHHVETNDIQEYTVNKLKNMKKVHEAKFINNNFELDEQVLKSILLQINEFWQNIEFLNKYKHQAPEDFKMEIDVNKKCIQIFDELQNNIENLSNMLNDIAKFNSTLWEDIVKFLESYNIDLSNVKNIPYYENPYNSPFWEMLCIGAPNLTNQSIILLKQFSIKYLELFIQQNPTNTEAIKKLNELREEFKGIAVTSSYID